jgi:hypothetical protein
VDTLRIQDDGDDVRNDAVERLAGLEASLDLPVNTMGMIHDDR